MKLRVFIENLAEQDLEACIDFIAADGPVRATRFIEAVQSAFDRLADMPQIGKRREFRNSRLTGVRAWPIPRFEKYLIFYRVTEKEIQIFRVLHGAQDVQSILDRPGGLHHDT